MKGVQDQAFIVADLPRVSCRYCQSIVLSVPRDLLEATLSNASARAQDISPAKSCTERDQKKNSPSAYAPGTPRGDILVTLASAIDDPLTFDHGEIDNYSLACVILCQVR